MSNSWLSIKPPRSVLAFYNRMSNSWLSIKPPRSVFSKIPLLPTTAQVLYLIPSFPDDVPRKELRVITASGNHDSEAESGGGGNKNWISLLIIRHPFAASNVYHPHVLDASPVSFMISFL
ncbi:hypothetical protein L1887_28858 [Cichorium endivia]|nr:hypothetical protein L1887_28858 [Cichorium endivia]